MMNKPLTILIIALWGLCSCEEKSADPATEGPVVKIDISATKEYDIVKPQMLKKLIPLETTPNSLIGDIQRLYVTKENIIVFDSQNNKILLFSANGRFLRQIGEQGRGPKEYVYFNDICFEAKDSLIYAFDRALNKMFIYDLSGRLTDAKESEYAFNSFTKVDNGYWLYSCFEDNNPDKYSLLHVEDDLKHIKEGYFPANNFANITFYPTFSQDADDNHYFYYPSSPSIYQVGDKLTTLFTPDFESKNLPYDLLNAAENLQACEAIFNREKYIGPPNRVIIHDGVCMFNCSETPRGIPTNSYFISYDLTARSVNVYDRFQCPEEFPFMSLFEILAVSDDNELVYKVNPSMLPAHKIERINDKYGTDLTDESNYALAFIQTKP